MDGTKPHRGRITEWCRYPVGDRGHVVFGTSLDHPRFANGPIRTSFIVAREGNEVETMNSRYTLVGDGVDIEGG